MADQERPSNQQYSVSPENMPPLEPTAAVPPVHSDKLNDPQYWNDKYQGRTANVPVEHRDDKTEKSGFGWKKPAAVGALVLATAASAFGIGKVTAGDHNTEPKSEPSVSASPFPSETPTEQPTEVSETPSSPATTETGTETDNGPITDKEVQSIDRDPSDAAIAYSLEPVSVEKFTPEQAAMRLMEDWKLYWLSGETSQSSDESQKLTPASIGLGEKQLDNIFGPESYRDETQLLWDWMTKTREYLTLNMGYLTVENGYDEDGTFNSSYDILSQKSIDADSVQFLVKNTWHSNMHELDSLIATQDIDSEEYSTDRYITITAHDGNYYITEIRSRAADQ